MNQIINMIIRQVMNQLIHRGIRAGFDRLGNGNQQGRGQTMPQNALDDHGNPVQQQLSPKERREQRHARQTARRATQSMKAARRLNRF